MSMAMASSAVRPRSPPSCAAEGQQKALVHSRSSAPPALQPPPHHEVATLASERFRSNSGLVDHSRQNLGVTFEYFLILLETNAGAIGCVLFVPQVDRFSMVYD